MVVESNPKFLYAVVWKDFAINQEGAKSVPSCNLHDKAFLMWHREGNTMEPGASVAGWSEDEAKDRCKRELGGNYDDFWRKRGIRGKDGTDRKYILFCCKK